MIKNPLVEDEIKTYRKILPGLAHRVSQDPMKILDPIAILARFCRTALTFLLELEERVSKLEGKEPAVSEEENTW